MRVLGLERQVRFPRRWEIWHEGQSRVGGGEAGEQRQGDRRQYGPLQELKDDRRMGLVGDGT